MQKGREMEHQLTWLYFHVYCNLVPITSTTTSKKKPPSEPHFCRVYIPINEALCISRNSARYTLWYVWYIKKIDFMAHTFDVFFLQFLLWKMILTPHFINGTRKCLHKVCVFERKCFEINHYIQYYRKGSPSSV